MREVLQMSTRTDTIDDRLFNLDRRVQNLLRIAHEAPSFPGSWGRSEQERDALILNFLIDAYHLNDPAYLTSEERKGGIMTLKRKQRKSPRAAYRHTERILLKAHNTREVTPQVIFQGDRIQAPGTKVYFGLSDITDADWESHDEESWERALTDGSADGTREVGLLYVRTWTGGLRFARERIVTTQSPMEALHEAFETAPVRGTRAIYNDTPYRC